MNKLYSQINQPSICYRFTGRNTSFDQKKLGLTYFVITKKFLIYFVEVVAFVKLARNKY